MRLVLAVLMVLSVTASAADKPPIEEIRGIRWPVFNRDTGRLEWKLAAVSARPVKENVYAVVSPDILLYADEKNSTVPGQDDIRIVADNGMFNREANIIDLSGNVILTVKDKQKTRMETSKARWDAAKRMATSDEHVLISNDSMIVTGRGFVFGPEDKNENSQPTILILREDVSALLKGSMTTANLFNPMQPEEDKQAAAGAKPDEERKPGDDVIITCDGMLRIDRARNIAEFSRNVRIEKRDSRLTCERLTIFTDLKTGDLKLLIAAGSVVMNDPSSDGGGGGDRLTWKAADGSGELSGTPAVTWLGLVRIDSPLITFSSKEQLRRCLWRKRATMVLPLGRARLGRLGGGD